MRTTSLLLIIAGAIVGVAGAPSRAAPLAPSRFEAADHGILVMLRFAPGHYRPGGDYGAAYGDSMARAARRRIALRIAHAHDLRVDDGWPMPLLGVDCFLMTARDGRDAAALATEVARDPGVAWAEPLHRYRAQGAPERTHDDPLFPAQPAARLWHLAAMHRLATGRGVTVAVIDSRIERSHPDLHGQLLEVGNFVSGPEGADEDHGTGVAGIIAAIADNGIGIAGVAPGARLMGLRACWQEARGTLCDSLSLAKALHFAIDHRAAIINMSLSGPRDRLLSELIAIGRARGASVVAATDAGTPDGGFPASAPGVIAVTDDALATPRAGLYHAPGREIPTTTSGGRWTLVNGSSFAAAHVSGLLALARERSRTATLITRAGAIDPCATVARASGVGENVCAQGTVPVLARDRR